MLLLLQASTASAFNLADLQLIAPELILSVIACVALVIEVILPYRQGKVTAYFSLAGIGLAAASLFALWSVNRDSLPLTGFYGMIRIDGFALQFLGNVKTVQIGEVDIENNDSRRRFKNRRKSLF